MPKPITKSQNCELIDKELVNQFATGVEEKHYTTVFLRSPNFVVFKVAGHTAWAHVGARAYVRTQYILARKGDFWLGQKVTIRRWEGRVKSQLLKEALRRSEQVKGVYTGAFDVPMCEECDQEMHRGEGLDGNKLVEYFHCDECGWSVVHLT